jgi:hypothetical protein
LEREGNRSQLGSTPKDGNNIESDYILLLRGFALISLPRKAIVDCVRIFDTAVEEALMKLPMNKKIRLQANPRAFAKEEKIAELQKLQKDEAAREKRARFHAPSERF